MDFPEWFNYRFVQHAHSHVALLGWLFTILVLAIIFYFKLSFSKYIKLLWSLQAMVIGMLFTFPIMGYAPLSIIFSTGHILISYVLGFYLWKELNHNKENESGVLLIKTRT